MMLHAAVEIDVGRAEPEVREHFLEQQFERAAVHVDVRFDRRGDGGDGVEVERDKFDRGVHADRAERAARDRVEECLVELPIGKRLDEFRKPPLDAAPHRAFRRLVAELRAHFRNGAIDVLVVKLDALHRVALTSAPVARFEALRRAPRDHPIFSVVVGERLHERRCALFDQRVA